MSNWTCIFIHGKHFERTANLLRRDLLRSGEGGVSILLWNWTMGLYVWFYDAHGINHLCARRASDEGTLLASP